MSGILKLVLPLLALAEIGHTQTSDEIGQNLCAAVANGTTDNLSCPPDPIEGLACFDRSLLCNGVEDCPGGEDEGADDTLSSLECKYKSCSSVSSYGCGILWNFIIINKGPCMLSCNN